MGTQTVPETQALEKPAGAPTDLVKVAETSSSAIAAREKAAVEARFVMALRQPRNFNAARLRLLDACKRPKFAKAARYAKPVGNSKAEGFSIRFAEEARVLWGNLDVSAFLVFDDDDRRIYRVIGTDLETNATEGLDVMVEKFVERRTVKEGQEVVGKPRQNSTGQTVYKIRAIEDDFVNKCNAQLSKVRRNVILSLISADVKEECETQVIETLRDRDAKDPAGARKDMLDAFWTLGVTPEQIGALLGKPLEQINPAELTLLRSIYTAIKESETTWSEAMEAFGQKKGNGGADTHAKGTEALKAKIESRKSDNKGGQAPAAAAPPAGGELPLDGVKKA